MRLNISQVKSYLSNPVRWAYEWVDRRVPKRSAGAALAVGTAMHSYFEWLHQGHSSSDALAIAAEGIVAERNRLLRENAPQASEDLAEGWAIVAAILPHWTDRYEFQTLAVEQVLEAPLPSGRHVLYGRPDRLAVWSRKLWHVQNRSLAGSKPMAPYLRAATLDPHELGYAWLVQQRRPEQPSLTLLAAMTGLATSYGGTMMNIVRKLQLTSKDGKRRLHEPSECFVQEFVPIDQRNVTRFIAGVDRLADDMEAISEGTRPRPSVCSDHCRLGSYGNSLCPYFDVCAGTANLSDDTLFTEATDPYEVREEAAK